MAAAARESCAHTRRAITRRALYVPPGVAHPHETFSSPTPVLLLRAADQLAEQDPDNDHDKRCTQTQKLPDYV
jgi:hypothetical protein